MKRLAFLLALLWYPCLVSSVPFAHLNSFELPAYFQIRQTIENTKWQHYPVRFVFVQSALNLEQLVERLAGHTPPDTILTRTDHALQLNWTDRQNSHLLELSPVSEHLTEGVYSTIGLVAARSGHSAQREDLTLIVPAKSTRLFHFHDVTAEGRPVLVLAYRTRLDPAQVAKQMSQRLKEMNWVVQKRFASKPYQEAWSTLEAVFDQQRMHISITPEFAETVIFIMRTE